MNYSTVFAGREMVGNEIILFRTEKPKDFMFLAGQWCFLVVPDIGFHDERGLRRAFSIASSPLEIDLLFVIKISDSALKRTMREVSLGASIVLESPRGNLTLPEDTSHPLVFLAGGVGIAPFRSLIRYAVDARTGHEITLFYSSQTPEETPFLDELLRVNEEFPNVSVIPTMTRLRESPSTWAGLTERINPEMIKNGCKDWEAAIYYVVGPPSMAAGMKQVLQEMNIPPARTKTELFTGY
jgi:ferredoxin-NADP reductase